MGQRVSAVDHGRLSRVKDTGKWWKSKTRLRTSRSTWVQQFGDALPGFSDDLHLASRSRSCICAELYGIGYCRSSFSDEQLLALENYQSVLNSIAHLLKDEFGQFGYLLQLRATDAAGAELGIIVVRILVTSFNPEYQLMVRYCCWLG